MATTVATSGSSVCLGSPAAGNALLQAQRFRRSSPKSLAAPAAVIFRQLHGTPGDRLTLSGRRRTFSLKINSTSPWQLPPSASRSSGLKPFSALSGDAPPGISGGNGGSGGPGGGGGGGGGASGEGGDDLKKKKMLSMSQKLTLAYALLVLAGGVMGFIKGRSVKSLAAGLTAGGILLYVFARLPLDPAGACSVGLGVSTVLLLVMGTRFQKSGKMMPAGVVSILSFIMTGGYIHGMMKTH